MNNEAEKTCTNCGKPLKEGAAFCTGCGAAVDTAAAAAAPFVPPGPVEPAAPAGGTPPPMPPMPPAAGAEGAVPAPEYAAGPAPKKNKAALVVGICGGVLVVAAIVVLVLWLAVWRDGGGGGTGDPIDLAQKYMDSLENGDIDAYMACFREDFFYEELANNPYIEDLGFTKEDLKEYARMAFEMMEVKFDGVKLEVSSQQDDKATVVTTAGTMSVSMFGMEEALDLADEPMEFKMVKEGGRWYLTENPMGATVGGDTDFDMGDLEDFDLEDLEDFDLDDLNLDDLEQYLPEGVSYEELMNMSPEDLEKMLEELEQLMQDLPQLEESGSST